MKTAKNTVEMNAQAAEIMRKNAGQSNHQLLIWLGALFIGGCLGWMDLPAIDQTFDFIAEVFTRLFQFIALPTIALAVTTTLSELGGKKETGRIFGRALTYTLLTTFAASIIGLLVYLWIAPGNLPADLLSSGTANVPENLGTLSYREHFMSIIPNNFIKAFLSGNALSVMLIAAACGLALAFMPHTENRQELLKALLGLQELLFTLIKALIWALPLGIMAFAGQLASQMEAGLIIGALGKYTAVILIGNCLQIFLVIPLFLLARGLNPFDVFKKVSPALTVALFTKSSAGTLPVTIAAVENRLKVNPAVSRFVLPLCTTINMNGCAAFILVTSLFVMQNSGAAMTVSSMIGWVFVSVIAAIGNAGVPMGCYFLTLSLTASMGAPAGIMGCIMPIYTIIDMVETAENVWSDSSVCVMTDHDLRGQLDDGDSGISAVSAV